MIFEQKEFNSDFLQMPQSSLTQTLLFGNLEFMTPTSSFAFNETVDFLLLTKRFDKATMLTSINDHILSLTFIT